MKDVIIDALLDSLKVFPFLLLIYVLMELIESAKSKVKIEKTLSGGAAPAVAGLLGAIPECGFSVMCAKLYDKGLIKLGTLIAAFISISDEGLIVLISSGASVKDILLLLGMKIVYAILAGEIINLIVKLVGDKNVHVCPEEGDCIECGEHIEEFWNKFLFHPLLHALKTFAFVLIFNFMFGTIIYLIGEENVLGFMEKSTGLQPLFAGIVGLIPNCASSIIITQAFTRGAISFSALAAGLSANAGVGYLILLKSAKKAKRNALILGLQFLLAVLLGYILLAFGL